MTTTTTDDDDDNDDENDGSPRSFAAVVAGGSGAAREAPSPPSTVLRPSAAVVRAGERFRGIVTKRVERLGAFVALPGVAKDGLVPAMGPSRSRRTVPAPLVSGARVSVVVVAVEGADPTQPERIELTLA